MQLEQKAIDSRTTQPAAARLQRTDRLSRQLTWVRDRQCEASFRVLYEFYAPRICAFLRQKGVDDRISQEIMQEAMTRVWLKANLFDDRKANASTWIYTIVRNLHIDIVRKTKRAEIDINDPLLVGKAEPAPDSGLENVDRNKMLMAEIARLPAEQSQVLRLVYLGGMKQQAVAEQLSIPLNTVKSRLRIALNKLRGQMEQA